MISVIVPAYNEEKFIGKTLQALTEGLNDKLIPHEIIVVNNGSTDNTAQIVGNFNEVKLIQISKAFPSTARNMGVSQSVGEVLAFIDGDTVVTDAWIEEVKKLNKSLDLPSHFLFGKAVLSPTDGKWIERIWFSKIKKNGFGGANLVLSRALFESIDGFDERLETGEDYDLYNRAKKLGAIVEENENLDATHLGFPQDIKNFCRREIWHGKGDCINIGAFIGSPVALLSLVYVVLSLMTIVFLLTQNFFVSMASFSALVVLNNLLIYKRFGTVKISELAQLNTLNFLYFYSRFLSLFK